MGVLKGCKPRKEVLHGDLDDAIFAADFGNLIAGKAPKVYQDPKTFFDNTHPAQQLRKVVEVVFGRLSDPSEGGATIRLSTGFGGGKTHTLMALWHLAKNIGNASLGTELLPAAGRPKKVHGVAVDAAKAGVPDFSVHDGTKIRSLWGETFYQLGGKKALQALGKADDPEASPSEAQIESAFPEEPVLLLLDELVIYMAKLSERGQGNLLGFLNLLGSVVGNRRQAILIVTDPADQRAYAREAAALDAKLVSAAVRLDDVLGRWASDFDPIGGEGARVIVRRLFETVDKAEAEVTSAVYHELYQRVAQELPGTVPAEAVSPEYAKRIVETYPFHPRLLDTAQDRLGALQEFNKSRGTLRLFARIIRDVWGAKEDLDLIGAGATNWSSPRIQADLLQRLNRDNFKAAVSADVGKHASELDGGAPRGIHRRVASALLFESVPMQAHSGLDAAELTLAVLRPDEAGHEPSEALDRLVGVCWHTYPMPGGRGWQFRYEPNVIKQIEERMGDIPLEDAKAHVLSEVQGYFSGPAFKLASWPSSARQVTDTAALQLVLCEDENIAKSVCAYADDSDPSAPIPRAFQNAIMAITASALALNSAVERDQRLLAAEAIERQHRKGEAGKLVREQLRQIMPELQKQSRLQACRAFDRVVLTGGVSYTLEEQFQVPDEQVLQRPHGQACLKRFLDEKNLIYQPGDALDLNRFLKEVLPGTTPRPGEPEVYTARAVHERFLSAPGLRLVADGSVIRQTLLKAVREGKIVVRLPDGRAYDSKGWVEGPEGRRRRVPGALTTLSLDDSVLIATTGSSAASEWVKEDKLEGEERKGLGERPVAPPPQPSRVEAITWEKALEYAPDRPLVELHLAASTPAAAATLATLAQPLGAESLLLSVTVTGRLKDGGTVSFAANETKLNHPTKPLAIAQTLFNAMADGVSYEALLVLSFGTAGRTGMEGPLGTLADAAHGDVSPRAIFEKPVGA